VGLRDVLDAEPGVDAGVIGVEPQALVQILEREIEIPLARIGRAAAGIGRHDLRIEPDALAEVGNAEVVVVLEPQVGDAAPDMSLAEIAASELLSRDKARAGGNAVLAIGRAGARRPVAAAERGELLLDPRDPFRRVPSSALLSVGIEAKRRAEIS